MGLFNKNKGKKLPGLVAGDYSNKVEEFEQKHKRPVVLAGLAVFVAAALFIPIRTLQLFGADGIREFSSAAALIQAGAESNYDKLKPLPSYYPSSYGGANCTKTLGGSVSQIEAGLAGMTAGQTLCVSDGTYSGYINLPSSLRGSEASPIVIRSLNKDGAVFTSGGFNIDSSFVIVGGFKFQTNTKQIFMLGGYKNRIYDNYIYESGNGDSGCCGGLVDAKSTGKVWNDPNPNMVDNYNRIDKNVFIRPKNTPISQPHGVVGNVYSHNIIEGALGFSGETMAIKIGLDAAAEDTKTYIQFNTIRKWDGAWPYVIGIKSSSTTVAYNYIEKGRLELRYGNRLNVIGNFINDGDMLIGGDSNIVRDNFVRVINDKDAFGPFAAYNRAITGLFALMPNAPYNLALVNSTIANNTFISNTSSPYESSMISIDMYGNTGNQHSNTFSNNTIIRTSRPASFTLNLTDGNTWNNNLFHCVNGCNDSQIYVPVLNVNGNRTGDPGIDINTTTPSIAFDSSFVSEAGSVGVSPIPTPLPTSTPIPTPSLAGTPVPTPTPTPQPTVTPTVSSGPGTSSYLEAESAVLVGNPAPMASQNNSADGSANHTGANGLGYIYSWQPTQTGAGVKFTTQQLVDGIYSMTLRYSAAAADSPVKDIRVNGATIAANISFPANGDWNGWAEVVLNNIKLPVGVATIEVISQSTHPANGWLNLDSMSLVRTAAVLTPTPTPVPTVAPTIAPISTQIIYNNSDSTLSGSWNTAYDNSNDYGRFKADEFYTNSRGARSSMTFTGTQVKIYGSTASMHGKLDVYIDGTKVTTVDTYSKTTARQVLLYSSGTLSNSQHKVEVVATGSKRRASKGTYITVDKFEILR